MSDAARSRLGDAHNLFDTMTAGWSPGDRKPDVWFPRVSRVVKIRDSLVVSVQMRPGGEVPHDDGAVLRDLETALLLHYFRLQQAERSLSMRARSTRTGSGPRAVRQLELERQRLGRELHTGVGQLLAAIRLQLEVVVQQLPQAPAGVRQALERIGTLAGDALEQVRGVSRRLHPPEWQRLKLEEALLQLWEISGIPQRYQTELRIQAPAREPELETKVLLYRAAQEALTNARKHAPGTEVSVRLDFTPETTVLVVDNGATRTVAAGDVAGTGGGFGLRGMRERIELVGGRFRAEPTTSGWTVEIAVPA